MSTAITTNVRHAMIIVAVLRYQGTHQDREALVMYSDGSTQWRSMRYIDIVA